MTISKDKLDAMLDEATREIREEQIDVDLTRAAAKRVSASLFEGNAPSTAKGQASGPIESCPDFQSLIPAFLAGELSSARSLLVNDHTLECVPCRRALKLARSGQTHFQKRNSAPPKRKNAIKSSPALRWAIAAAVVIGFGLIVFPIVQRYMPFGDKLGTTVLAAEGTVYEIGESGNSIVGKGSKIDQGVVIRTSMNGHAVLGLSDGSTLELGDRSEVSVDKTGRNTTVHLGRGNLIVSAAKQKQGDFYVSTDDALISTKDTILSVNSGLKGSRLSVVRGAAQLNHEGTQTVVQAGEQAVTSQTLESKSIRDDLKWSNNAEKYLEILSQIAAIRKELNSVPQPGVRTSTRLLDLMPENTVLYAALPNLAETLAESNRIFESRIDQNPALRAWWDERSNREHDRTGIDQTIDRIRKFGEVLGDEIAVGATMDKDGKPVGPIVVATLKDAERFRQLVNQEIQNLAGNDKQGPSIVFIDELNTPPVSGQDAHRAIYLWIKGDLLVATPQLEQLQELANRVGTGAGSRFDAGDFHQRIADVYAQGAGIVVAADLRAIIGPRIQAASTQDSSDRKFEVLKQLGVNNLNYFVAEQKVVQQRTFSRAVLGFNESTHGVTSWLAAPGPMGSLDYISPDANVVSAFVVNKPVGLVDDILSFIDTAAPDFSAHLKQVEAEHNIDLRQDIAAPLGGEFAFAIDGPILPTPSWKMVFEVNDPAKLQNTFEHMVSEVNNAASAKGIQMLAWDNTTVSGRTFYKVRSVQFGLEVDYTFVNGYLVAAPTLALVDTAIRYHDSGLTLKTSRRFQSALPPDGGTQFSAIFYHDLAGLVGPIADRIKSAAPGSSESSSQNVASLAANSTPTLAYAYAGKDSIVVASNAEGGPFGIGPGAIVGMPNSLDMQHIIQSGLRGDKSK